MMLLLPSGPAERASEIVMHFLQAYKNVQDEIKVETEGGNEFVAVGD